MTDLTFTPRISAASEDRARMNLSAADMDKIGRGSKWSATVTDQNTGLRYRVRGASCGLPRCFCDAVITHIFPK
jgi:hypothetical protein